MKEITAYECEGCGKLFRKVELIEGKIGYHAWKPDNGRYILWDREGFSSRTEEDCTVQMIEWDRQQAMYEERKNRKRIQREQDEDLIINACGKDTLLASSLEGGNYSLAKIRVKQLAEEIGVSWWELTQGFYQRSEALARRCFEATGGMIDG